MKQSARGKKVEKYKESPLQKRDVYTIVLEDLRGQFKVFGESLDDMKRNLKAVKKRGDETFEEVGNIKVEITEIKTEITEIKTRLDSIEKRLSRIESKPAKAQAEIEFLKKESMAIKSCSDDEDVHERLNIFEARIGRIEKQLKLSVA
jgi:predicted nuclease with TOPRIM domain